MAMSESSDNSNDHGDLEEEMDVVNVEEEKKEEESNTKLLSGSAGGDDNNENDNDDKMIIEESENRVDGDHSRNKYDDDPMNRKPSAKPPDGSHEEEDDDKSTSSSSSSEDEEEDDNNNNVNVGMDTSDNNTPKYVDDEGRPVSEYEYKRLQRIKRNKKLLEQLGLEKKDGSTTSLLTNNQNKSKKKKSIDTTAPPPVPTRKSISRRSKMKMKSYAEPSTSVRDILALADSRLPNNNDSSNDTNPDNNNNNNNNGYVQDIVTIPPEKDEKVIQTKDEKSVDNNNNNNSMNNNNNKEENKNTPKKKRKERSHKERMEQSIYMEFMRIKSNKTNMLKQSERNVRNAEREIKYWKKLLEIYKKQQKKKQLIIQEKQNIQYERTIFNGITMKQLLYKIDIILPNIMKAIKQYDDNIKAEERELEKEQKRVEAEQKMKLLTAIDQFPKAMKNAITLLNTVLLERSPKDPPPPRRSRRSVQSITDEPTNTPSRNKRGREKLVNQNEDSTNDTPELVSLNETLPTISSNTNNKKDENGGNAGGEELEKETASKRRKKVRNVGGWVSPDFSDEIDRRWLKNDLITFHLKAYVPQPGDIVLYYITGHKLFLERYPDFLGKKTKSKMRMPLWERAQQMKENHATENVNGSNTSKIWWTDKWLQNVETSFGDYPILCRVEKAHAEFPPDPYIKVLKKDDKTKKTKISFKKPKSVTDSGHSADKKLRLCVTLRPLTPVVPPDENEKTAICPPPIFSVITFPSEMEPFLIPFSWAYCLSHSLSLNKKVMLEPERDTVRVDGFKQIEGHGALRMEDCNKMIFRFLATFEKSLSKYLALRDELDKSSLDLPLRDAHIVIECWQRKLRTIQSPDTILSENGNESAVKFVDILQRTLPLWNSVNILRNMYDRKKTQCSPWNLRVKDKSIDVSSPWSIGQHEFFIDETLRLKIICYLEQYLLDNPDETEIFYDPIPEDKDFAPSYYCAVPVGMSLSHIIKRLQARGKTGKCYYRSVDAILADVTAILDACLLYNSPDSEVVETASKLVTSIRTSVLNIFREYSREVEQTRKADEERRLLLFRHRQKQASEESPKPKSEIVNYFRKPFKEEISRDWLYGVNSVDNGSNPSVGQSFFGPFQAGDKIRYSRSRHERFVEGHFLSLEPYQCLIPGLSETIVFSQEQNSNIESNVSNGEDWVDGEVLWTRAAFPKPLKSDTSDNSTFSTRAVLQCLGVKLLSSNVVQELFWRPCLFALELSGKVHPCSCCGLDSLKSFVYIDQVEMSQSSVNTVDEQENRSLSGKLHSSYCRKVDRCFDLLKRRCLREIPSAHIDPELTKENINQGYKIPLAKIGKRSFPALDKIFENGSTVEETCPRHRHGTRGVSLKSQITQKDDGPLISKLVSNGFLPRWISSNEGVVVVDEQERLKCDTFSPTSFLCLELIQRRLRNGFYRQKSAIENDLVEAYTNAIYMHLHEALSRKHDPISIKRIAKILCGKILVNKNASDEQTSQFREEEGWAERVQGIRELYATALVAVLETKHVEQLFGLVEDPSPKVITTKTREHDEIRAKAREELSFLMEVFGRDLCANRTAVLGMDGSLPLIRLSVRVNGKEILSETEPSEMPIATFKGKDTRIHIMCEKRPFHFKSIQRTDSNLLSPRDNQHPTKDRSIAAHVYLGPEVYERNDSLAKILFRRPNWTGPCARCQTYKRDYVACRVVRHHSNPDFDWALRLQGGMERITNLMRTLNPECVDGSVLSSCLLDAEMLRVEQEDDICLQNKNDEAEEDCLDPSENYNKAVAAFEQSSKLLEEAKHYSDAPVRLSKDFIKGSFPVDAGDGHYLYCVVCGLSGDLLCCDGCPNVVHCKCVSLSELPEGDWFCPECENSKNSEVSENGQVPFERNEFDETKVDLLTEWLDELRSVRLSPNGAKEESELYFDEKGAKKPDQTVTKDNSILIKQRRTSSAKNNVEDSDEEEVDTPTPIKRKRGRPRKHQGEAQALEREIDDSRKREKQSSATRKLSKVTDARNATPATRKDSNDRKKKVVNNRDNGSEKRTSKRSKGASQSSKCEKESSSDVSVSSSTKEDTVPNSIRITSRGQRYVSRIESQKTHKALVDESPRRRKAELSKKIALRPRHSNKRHLLDPDCETEILSVNSEGSIPRRRSKRRKILTNKY